MPELQGYLVRHKNCFFENTHQTREILNAAVLLRFISLPFTLIRRHENGGF